jgi:cleavage stimulation factor subunit 3
MADFVAEDAFLHSMTGESNVATEYNVDRNPEPAVLPEPAAAHDEDDDGDYDPSVLVTEAKPPPKSTSTPPQNVKRKGGFLIDSDDEDGDGNAAPAANGVGGVALGTQRSSTGTPVTSTEAHVSVPSDQNLASQPVPSNPPTSTPSSRAVHAPPASKVESTTRDPNDTVGILEDRIQEDPRGDVEAWLALLQEHRSHDRFDHVRNVYTRFFQYFPTAVSCFLLIDAR